MTNSEFSYEFDILYNNIASNSANPGIDEYEKSVFLTKALEQLILEFYTGNNPLLNSIEKTELAKRDFSSILNTETLTIKESGVKGLTSNSTFYKLPTDVWFLTYEIVELEDANLEELNHIMAIVIPTSQDDLFRTLSNPFKKEGFKRVLRLDTNDNIIELISEFNISKYIIRYISKPRPIILENLLDGLTINGISTKSECELGVSIHRDILDRAVLIAKQAMTNK